MNLHSILSFCNSFCSLFFNTVGKPIPVEKIANPTQEDIDDLHQVYVDALNQLFDKHKMNYGIDKDVKLDLY